MVLNPKELHTNSKQWQNNYHNNHNGGGAVATDGVDYADIYLGVLAMGY